MNDVSRFRTLAFGLAAIAIAAAACSDTSHGNGDGGGGAGGQAPSPTSATTSTTASAGGGPSTSTSTGSAHGGGGSGGAGGSSTGSTGGGGSTGSAGGGGAAPCLEITPSAFHRLAGDGQYGWYEAPVTPDQGGMAADMLEIQFYGAAADPSLGWGPERDLRPRSRAGTRTTSTCSQCVYVLVDRSSAVKAFFQSSGTIDVRADSDTVHGAVDATLTDVTLIEITFDPNYVSVPVPGGACVHITTLGRGGALPRPAAARVDLRRPLLRRRRVQLWMRRDRRRLPRRDPSIVRLLPGHRVLQHERVPGRHRSDQQRLVQLTPPFPVEFLMKTRSVLHGSILFTALAWAAALSPGCSSNSGSGGSGGGGGQSPMSTSSQTSTSATGGGGGGAARGRRDGRRRIDRRWRQRHRRRRQRHRSAAEARP